MPRILVVEDEPAIAESIAYSLRRDGFAVSVAGALAAAEREVSGADLVILDLMLPDGSGFDLIGQIRRSGQGTAVIVLSSRDGEADRVAALETGADDYVTKPFSPREIVARVRAVLRRAARPSGDGAPASAAPGAGDVPRQRPRQADGFDARGVRPARVHARRAGPRVHPRAAHRPGVGGRLRHHGPHGGLPRQGPAQEGRGGRRGGGARGDGPRRGVPRHRPAGRRRGARRRRSGVTRLLSTAG